MKPYTNWASPENEARLHLAAQDNKSISGMCRSLGIAPKGGNIATLKYHIARLDIDISHHTGQGWNKENYAEPQPTHDSRTIKARLIREHGYKCWACELSAWQGQSIPLELDHIDGNNRNNSEENLQILCCNCHALTPTFRNKKRKGR